MGGVIFNGAAGTQPFTNRGNVPEEVALPQIKPSRLVGEELMLLLLLMPPVRFRVESRTSSTVHLVWEHTVVTSRLVELDRALGDASFFNIATLPGGTTTYTDTGLAEGTRYRYRLRLA